MNPTLKTETNYPATLPAPRRSGWPKALAVTLAVLTVAFTSGCVRKILHVTTSPSGAQLFVNNVYRGRTPVDVPFNWNWFYEIRAEAPGHESYRIRERLYAPPRHVIGPDLIAELMPWGSREDPKRHYVLRPLQQP